ncbi:hypothetical protein BvRS1_25720 [Burkholderia vietnamiensis]|nr:hypothetical protein BvRS1_25720 [Burkholderia vietnamiensis]
MPLDAELRAGIVGDQIDRAQFLRVGLGYRTVERHQHLLRPQAVDRVVDAIAVRNLDARFDADRGGRFDDHRAERVQHGRGACGIGLADREIAARQRLFESRMNLRLGQAFSCLLLVKGTARV